MLHTPRTLAAAFAISAAMLSPIAGCDTDTNPPGDDTGIRGGQDTGSITRDSGGTRDTGSLQDASADASKDISAPDSSAPDSGVDTGAADVGRDTSAADMGATDSGPVDAGADTGTDDMGAADMGAGDSGLADMDSADMGSADMGAPDMNPGVDYSNRPEGMCVTSSNCGAGLTCNRETAGGTCTGCGDCSNIPGPDTHTCRFGTCVRDCSSDDDCAPGRQCNSGGLCVVERCSNGVCPVPWFVCTSSDLCTRATCFNGEACPAETTCTGGVCIEDHSLP